MVEPPSYPSCTSQGHGTVPQCALGLATRYKEEPCPTENTRSIATRISSPIRRMLPPTPPSAVVYSLCVCAPGEVDVAGQVGPLVGRVAVHHLRDEALALLHKHSALKASRVMLSVSPGSASVRIQRGQCARAGNQRQRLVFTKGYRSASIAWSRTSVSLEHRSRAPPAPTIPVLPEGKMQPSPCAVCSAIGIMQVSGLRLESDMLRPSYALNYPAV